MVVCTRTGGVVCLADRSAQSGFRQRASHPGGLTRNGLGQRDPRLRVPSAAGQCAQLCSALTDATSFSLRCEHFLVQENFSSQDYSLED